MASEASVTYPEYLRLGQLLQSQHPLAPAALGPQVHSAEHFFIVTGARAGLPYLAAEALVALSESFWLLTAAHVHAAERTIGDRPGTGGTSGVAYLQEALRVKAFPELWAVRTRL